MVVKVNFAEKFRNRSFIIDGEKQSRLLLRLCFFMFLVVCIVSVTLSAYKFIRLRQEISADEARLSYIENKKEEKIKEAATKSNDESAVVNSNEDNNTRITDIPVIEITALIKTAENIAACVDVKNVGEGITLYPGMIFLEKGKIISIDLQGIDWSWTDKKIRTNVKQ